MANQPKWSTPERKANLVRLFVRSRGFCIFKHPNCTIPDHHYEIFIDGLVKDWQAEDRALNRQLWLIERKAIHNLGETRTPVRGRFSNIARDVWAGKQPLFYVECLGMSGLTLKPFAKVKLSSSYLRLYVDLGDSLRKVSKHARRKAIRYGKPLPKSASEQVNHKIALAVIDYLK